MLANPGNQSGETGSAVMLPMNASDADGDTLTYSASGLPSGLGISSASGTISGTPTAAGVANVTVTVSDGETSASASFSWTVEDPAVTPPPTANTPPVLTNPGDQSGETGIAVSLALSASDADGDSLSFSANGLPAGLSIDISTGIIAGTPTTSGSSNVRITVSDGSSSDSVSFGWTVSDLAPPALGSVTLQWTPPTQNEDGSALEDLAGYKIYYGTAPGSYGPPIRVDNPGISTYVIDSLPVGTYYFVATAFNAAGIESGFSNVASKVVN